MIRKIDTLPLIATILIITGIYSLIQGELRVKIEIVIPVSTEAALITLLAGILLLTIYLAHIPKK